MPKYNQVKSFVSRVRYGNPSIIEGTEGDSFQNVDLRKDKRLMVRIVEDLEYGVTNRPSSPACWEEDDELGTVDKSCDIRTSQWDELSATFNPVNIQNKAKEFESKVEKQNDPKDAE